MPWPPICGAQGHEAPHRRIGDGVAGFIGTGTLPVAGGTSSVTCSKGEAVFLQSFAQQPEFIANPPHELHAVAQPVAEHMDARRERVQANRLVARIRPESGLSFPRLRFCLFLSFSLAIVSIRELRSTHCQKPNLFP